MHLRSIRIGWRLTLGFGAILALAVLVLAAEIVVSAAFRQHQSDAIRHASAKAAAAEAMRGALLEAGIAMRNVGLQRSTPDMEREKARLLEQQKRFKDARATLSGLGLDAEENAILARTDSLEQKTGVPFREVERLLGEYAGEAAASLISSSIDPLNRQAIAEIDQLVARQRNALLAVLDDTEERGRRNAIMLLCVGLLCIGAGAVFSVLTTRSIVVPLRQAVDIARRIEAGRLHVDVEVRERDEPAELLKALSAMAEKLSTIVSRVRSGTDEIVTGAHRLAQENSDLSARTGVQARALEETASSMEEMTATVRRNSDHAQQAARLVQNAYDAASAGNLKVAELSAAMAAVETGAAKVSAIVGLIEGLAFQTNILALNATVEAAHAGEKGRGFAVVAAEVRMLAERCSQAAHDIRDLISGSVTTIRHGNGLACAVERQMQELVGAASAAAGLMSEIAAANREQDAGILQIERMVTSMDDATRRNAAMVEQAAREAAGMQALSGTLRSTVDAFDLGIRQDRV